ncbi:MAG TPA: peptidoglycan editing factor PgeF [Verrucomicrobiae bacterium]|jgi:YfiH family protein|nr:peptidoglycan editing factor PgeF [Verrucomicrobiae bacterium]
MNLHILEAPNLKALTWLVHGFSTRAGGVSTCYGGKTLNLGLTKDDKPEYVARNRKLLLSAAGAATRTRPWPMITLRQVHSDLIHAVTSRDTAQLAGDGLVTNLSSLVLAVQTADCFPILLVDTKNRAVGAFHAGWRGTVGRIVEKGLGMMRREYGTRPQDVHAAIGPGIQQCCYEVGEELKNKFESQFPYAAELFREVQESDPVREKYPMLFMNARAPGHGDSCTKLHLDLQEANRRQLLAAGVPETQITALQGCTACDTKTFFSHRAEKGTTGRMMAVVGVKAISK